MKPTNERNNNILTGKKNPAFNANVFIMVKMCV